MADGRKYKDEDVRAIMDKALSRPSENGMSHDDLLSIAAEVGLSRDTIETAVQEVEETRLNAEATSAVVARRRRWLASHAFFFTAVNAFLFAINFLTTPGEWWVLFPLIGWGLALLLHAGLALSSRVSAGGLNREKRRLQERQKARALPRQRIEDASAEGSVRVSNEAALDDDTAEPPAPSASNRRA